MNDAELTDKILTENGYISTDTGDHTAIWENEEDKTPFKYKVWCKSFPAIIQVLVRYHHKANTDVFFFIGGVLQDEDCNEAFERTELARQLRLAEEHLVY